MVCIGRVYRAKFICMVTLGLTAIFCIPPRPRNLHFGFLETWLPFPTDVMLSLGDKALANSSTVESSAALTFKEGKVSIRQKKNNRNTHMANSNIIQWGESY